MTARTRRKFLIEAGVAGLSIAGAPRLLKSFGNLDRPPNIIFILADDLGYAELGCYGQQRIRTPNIDTLANEGVRFTQCYSGSPVCAPSRCVLMTGKHTGHAFIRDNREIQPEGQHPLPADAVTLPRLLKHAGYKTALIGKWGLGFPGSTGDPLKQGFDHFFGYNCQRKAHNHYPESLWRNGEKIVLAGNDGKGIGKQYAPDLMEAEAIHFIRSMKEHPFFLFLATTIPHLALQVPEDSLAEYVSRWDDPPYDGKKGYLPHKNPRSAYAAMVSRLDRTVGRISRILDDLGIAEETLIVFASDNGSTYDIGGYDPAFFRGTGIFRAAKGSVYEGGIRVPFIARWPGHIRQMATSDHLFAFQDLLPTFLEIAGRSQDVPLDVDGISVVPELLVQKGQKKHEYLYMEFPAYGGQQMVRWGEWKGVRQNLLKNPDAPLELYNLNEDPGEQNDIAGENPGVAAQIADIMLRSHTPSREFPFPALDRLQAR